MKKWKGLLHICLVAVVLLFFALLFFFDNKYKAPPPYGHDGLLSLTQDDLAAPVFLIDGWLLSDDEVVKKPSYIGQYASLQRGDVGKSPHGEASYQLTLRYQGAAMEVGLHLPQLFYRHKITLDGAILSQGIGGTQLFFTLTQGDHVLLVETQSRLGYYSSLYHPPVLGQSEAIFKMVLIQCIAYCLAFFSPLVLALFTLVLWRRGGDRGAFYFGLLCLFFSLYVSYYFVALFSFPLGLVWHFIQSAAFYGLCFCALRLAALSGEVADTSTMILLQRIHVAAAGLLLSLALLIPLAPWAVWMHGLVTDSYYVFTFLSLLFVYIKSPQKWGLEQGFTRLACVAFGMGLVCNVLSSNLFEPIYFFWQFEWCGLLLVVLFGAMMATRNRRILAENHSFQTRLEELVQERTAQLTTLMQERKAFFADMAHDLKAPLYAAAAFIETIRENNTGVDGELLRYIDLVEEKRQEMTLRVAGLAALNQMDEFSQGFTQISVCSLLEAVCKTHYMTAQVQSVYLLTQPPETDAFFYGQQRQLEILFENLIFNALRATARGGKITVRAEIDHEGCHFSVEDTGKGITAEELPHIFQRFYVGEQNIGLGSGLGLYIVKSIVSRHHGEVTVSSKPGLGSVFYIDFPMIKQ